VRNRGSRANGSGPRTAVILTIAVAVFRVTASGQEAGGGNAVARTFWVTEAGYSYSATGGCSDHYPSLEVGKLINLGGSFAVGGSAFVGHNEDLVYGPRPRLRYWASDHVAFDFAAGLLWGASRSRPAGFAGVNYRDLLSVVLQYERYRDGGCGQPTENQVFLGVKVGSRPGIITGLVGSVVGGIIIAIAVSGVEN
jgi:hypothetical protein